MKHVMEHNYLGTSIASNDYKEKAHGYKQQSNRPTTSHYMVPKVKDYGIYLKSRAGENNKSKQNRR